MRFIGSYAEHARSSKKGRNQKKQKRLALNY